MLHSEMLYTLYLFRLVTVVLSDAFLYLASPGLSTGLSFLAALMRACNPLKVNIILYDPLLLTHKCL
uniref:Putative secreted protein n=1 Tax=Ixodes ricinus TaxID=34613 RepID=A0A6B0U1A8_IXORI